MSDIPAQVHGAKLVYFFELSKYFAIFEQKNLIVLVYSQKTQYLYTNFCYKLLEDKQIHHSGKQIVAIVSRQLAHESKARKHQLVWFFLLAGMMSMWNWYIWRKATSVWLNTWWCCQTRKCWNWNYKRLSLMRANAWLFKSKKRCSRLNTIP